ncbi:MAG: hypothetical protein OEU90_09545 [Gammaproteobacteria bacterium]|jgi:hypothetical protein|nr:hypothetical protein [Gammaproteobacteria bacterium]MDH3750638.1 hypothetical protein [Gammaproteobacteria bacterium]MDH3805700.1 hypothetical protein [Gammaproteobacteria bacterium]
MKQAKDQGWITPLWRILLVAVLSAGLMTPAQAGFREQAKRIHDRLAGVPPSDTVLQQMEDAINPALPGTANDAAVIAMNNANFYNVTLKNFAAPWTNRDQSVFVPLNDYIATVIGMVRDDAPFNTLLSADLTYVGSSGPAPSAANNDHYAQLEANNVNLRDELTDVAQSSISGIPPSATAGIMTSRAASEAFFIAGTNRAMFRFTLLNHMCNDMEQVHDPKLPTDRIRQDVSRSPGGDSRLFLNNCVGCHTGMDPMAQAFAYYNYNDVSGRLEYSGVGPGLGGTVQPKYFNNDLNFPQGFRTPDDAWENRWRKGQNAYLGFDQSLPGSGSGAKSLGDELGNSVAFASCQVRKVFRAVCLRDPENAADRARADQMTTDFMTTFGYRMKDVFAETAVYCMGQ